MRDRHYKLVATLMFVFLGLWTIISLFPYYFQFITGFKGIEEVNRITPTFWPDEFLWSNLGLVYEAQGVFAGAEEAFARALELHPGLA